MQASPPAPEFSDGPNVAIKTPPALYRDTVRFYRDMLGLQVIETDPESTLFRFGDIRLWVDCSEAVAETETWLEVRTVDPAAAARHLALEGVQRCDAVERLPDGFGGFWIRSPAGQVHLVCGTGEA